MKRAPNVRLSASSASALPTAQLLKGNKPYGLTKAEAKAKAKKRRF
jgi:hypothetical protein